MKQIFLRKLKGRGGFTLTEMLVGLMLLVLTLGVLTSGMHFTLRQYRISRSATEAITLSSTLYQALSDEIRFAQNIQTVEAGDSLRYDSAVYGPSCLLACDESGYLTAAGQLVLSSMAYPEMTVALSQVSYSPGQPVHLTLTITAQTGYTLVSDFSLQPVNG